MFKLNDFFAYFLLGFMLLAITLAFWLRFTWFPTLFSPPPAKEDNSDSKRAPDLLERHYNDGVISRATYKAVRRELKEAMC